RPRRDGPGRRRQPRGRAGDAGEAGDGGFAQRGGIAGGGGRRAKAGGDPLGRCDGQALGPAGIAEGGGGPSAPRTPREYLDQEEDQAVFAVFLAGAFFAAGFAAAFFAGALRAAVFLPLPP